MLKKNSMLAGVLAALIFPVIAFVISFLLKNNVDIINRPGLPYFIAIALNLVLIRISFKKGLDHTAKGIMLATFVSMLLIFIFKIHPIR
jgi:uncharacterized protein YacL